MAHHSPGIRNVTITLDEEVARWAGNEASRRTTLSRLVGEMLRERMDAEARYEAARRAFAAVRPRTSATRHGRLPSREQLLIVPVFVDTNVLIYRCETAEPDKQR